MGACLVEEVCVAHRVPEGQLQIGHDREDAVALLQRNHASSVRDLHPNSTLLTSQPGTRHNYPPVQRALKQPRVIGA